MYPLVALLVVAVWRADARWALTTLPLSIPGALIASYHVYIQAHPTAEANRCIVGSCTSVDWTFLGLSTPQWSFLAFALISAAGIAALARGERAGRGPGAEPRGPLADRRAPR